MKFSTVAMAMIASAFVTTAVQAKDIIVGVSGSSFHEERWKTDVADVTDGDLLGMIILGKSPASGAS